MTVTLHIGPPDTGDPGMEVVSRPRLADADDEAARRAVGELGGESVQLVVTISPLASILPLAWQRYLTHRLPMAYGDWLDAMFNQAPYDEPTPTFWRRHHHDALVERWAGIVGPTNITVVVPASNEPAQRPLTAAECEVIRAINVEFAERGWNAVRYEQTVRNGVVPAMRRRPADAASALTTPAWAVERANETAALAADRIRASGVRVIGDLGTLSKVEPETAPTHIALSIDDAAAAVMGAVDAAGRRWKLVP